ncbi:MAG: hypothetical protein HQL37_01155 [Alphaproteobacteria bacterium]|nr:hypothetical protein [Alphaproteobacteria bacterium]
MKRWRWSVACAAALVTMAGACAGGGEAIHDPSANLTRNDYESLRDRRPKTGASTEPAIPEFQPVVATPREGATELQKIVTVSFNESVSVKDILIELARKAKVDLELDPHIDSNVIFSAYDRPFQEVIARITDLAGLRYTFKNGVLRVEKDDPYIVNYRVDGLNVVRTATETMSASTDVFSAVSGSGGNGGNNGSTASLRSNSSGDLWGEVEKGLDQIIKANQMTKAGLEKAKARMSGSGSEESLGRGQMVPGQAPPLLPAQQQQSVNAKTVEELTKAALNNAKAASLQQEMPLTDLASRVGKTPTTATTELERTLTGGVSGSVTISAKGDGDYYSINKQAGIATVYADSRTQDKIAAYLKQVMASLASQVLIEARIVEVSLNNDFRAGIDWTAAFGPKTAVGGNNKSMISTTLVNGTNAAVTTDVGSTLGNVFAASLNIGRDLNAAVNLLNQFGTQRTLSSPRLTVLNNQTAMLKVAKNSVYFRVAVSSTPATTTTPATYLTTSTMNTVPIGLVMTVQPYINPDTDEIILTLRPTVSRVVGEAADPAVALQALQFGGAITSNVPVVEVREMDSVIRTHSGGVVVMGGMMEEQGINTEMSVPGVSDIPGVGNLFKGKNESSEVTELVIFLTAKIVDKPLVTVDKADYDLYQKYTRDPRPLAF